MPHLYLCFCLVSSHLSWWSVHFNAMKCIYSIFYFLTNKYLPFWLLIISFHSFFLDLSFQLHYKLRFIYRTAYDHLKLLDDYPEWPLIFLLDKDQHVLYKCKIRFPDTFMDFLQPHKCEHGYHTLYWFFGKVFHSLKPITTLMWPVILFPLLPALLNNFCIY